MHKKVPLNAERHFLHIRIYNDNYLSGIITRPVFFSFLFNLRVDILALRSSLINCLLFLSLFLRDYVVLFLIHSFNCFGVWKSVKYLFRGDGRLSSSIRVRITLPWFWVLGPKRVEPMIWIRKVSNFGVKR
jgi:hypothetical protein